MKELVQQILAFISFRFLQNYLKYSFIVLNIIPVFYILFLGQGQSIFLEYFLVDSIIIILLNYQFLKSDSWLGLGLIRKAIMILIDVLIIGYNIYIIIDPTGIDLRQQSFFQFVAIISTAHLITYLSIEGELIGLPKSFFQKEILLKVFTLILIIIIGNLVEKYFKSKMGYLVALIILKTLIDATYYIPRYRQIRKNNL